MTSYTVTDGNGLSEQKNWIKRCIKEQTLAKCIESQPNMQIVADIRMVCYILK